MPTSQPPKPTIANPVFIQKLEHQLRLNYRQEFSSIQAKTSQPAAFSWAKILSYGIAFTSGALVLGVFLFNVIFQDSLWSNTSMQPNFNEIVTFDQGKAEEELLTNFENEMDQIDQGITLAVASH